MSECRWIVDTGQPSYSTSPSKPACSMQLHWTGAFAALHVGFFSVHYLFASQVGHVGALYGAFLAMMLAAGDLNSGFEFELCSQLSILLLNVLFNVF